MKRWDEVVDAKLFRVPSIFLQVAAPCSSNRHSISYFLPPLLQLDALSSILSLTSSPLLITSISLRPSLFSQRIVSSYSPLQIPTSHGASCACYLHPSLPLPPHNPYTLASDPLFQYFSLDIPTSLNSDQTSDQPTVFFPITFNFTPHLSAPSTTTMTKTPAMSHSAPKLTIGIVGFGNFGQFIGKVFAKQGHR